MRWNNVKLPLSLQQIGHSAFVAHGSGNQYMVIIDRSGIYASFMNVRSPHIPIGIGGLYHSLEAAQTSCDDHKRKCQN